MENLQGAQIMINLSKTDFLTLVNNYKTLYKKEAALFEALRKEERITAEKLKILYGLKDSYEIEEINNATSPQHSLLLTRSVAAFRELRSIAHQLFNYYADFENNHSLDGQPQQTKDIFIAYNKKDTEVHLFKMMRVINEILSLTEKRRNRLC
jgi:hypothetical protein